MLKADRSVASLEKAAKHLFRHLYDAAALRRNPLVRRFFIHGDATWRRTNDQLVLSRIHELVKQGAQHCRDADVLEGHEGRALRQHAIVLQQCLAQRPVSEVAHDLGISLKHCYRQRAEICRRIARFVSQYDDARALEYTPDLDTFRIALDRVAHRCTILDSNAAARECEDLIRKVASSPTQSIEALRVAATTAFHFGDMEAADALYSSATRIYRENQSDPSFGSAVARACLDLIASKMAVHRADPGKALALAKRASLELRSAERRGPERITELYVESLYELGATTCNLGDIYESYQHLREAETVVKRMNVSSARLRARIALAVWKLRTHLLVSSAPPYTASQRQRGLTSAFELAYGFGSLPEATAAIVALVEHHALIRSDDEALRAARVALALAENQTSDRMRNQTSIELAAGLALTRYWAFGFTLLPRRELHDGFDAYHRELVVYVLAVRALRRRRFEDAWALTRTNSEHAEFEGLALSSGLVAASAAYNLGRRRDAKALVEAILSTAERLALAPALREAYRLAATITGEARFNRRARELSKLLTE